MWQVMFQYDTELVTSTVRALMTPVHAVLLLNLSILGWDIELIQLFDMKKLRQSGVKFLTSVASTKLCTISLNVNSCHL